MAPNVARGTNLRAWKLHAVSRRFWYKIGWTEIVVFDGLKYTYFYSDLLSTCFYLHNLI